MNLIMRQATPDDAQAIIGFMDRIAGESDNLTLDVGDRPRTRRRAEFTIAVSRTHSIAMAAHGPGAAVHKPCELGL